MADETRNASPKEILGNLSKVFISMSNSQRASIVFLILALIISLMTMVSWTADVKFEEIKGLDDNQLALAQEQLLNSGIEAKVENKILLIPAEKIHIARRKLMKNGGAIGKKIFDMATLIDEQSAWATLNMQKQQYSVALQNELANAIATFDIIDTASVLITKEEDPTFLSQQKKRKASINIRTTSAERLPVATQRAIINLVASAVSDLNPQDVKVIDASFGETYEMPEDNNAEDKASTRQALERKEEDCFEKKIRRIFQEMDIRSTTIVSVRLNVDMKHTNSRAYDTEGSVVRNVHKQKNDKTQNVPGSSTTGVTPNVNSPNVSYSQPASGGASNIDKSQQSTVGYELSHTDTEIIYNTGDFDEIKAVVVVDYKLDEDGETLIPRTPQEISEYQAIVAGVLMSSAKNTTVVVQSQPFAKKTEKADDGLSYLIFAFIKEKWAAGIMLILSLVALRYLYKLTIVEVPEEEEIVFEMGEDGESLEVPADDEHTLQVLEALRDMVEEDPNRSAGVLKRWISE